MAIVKKTRKRAAKKKKRKLSPAQKQIIRKFRAAELYGKVVENDPALTKIYSKGITKKLRNARRVAHRDRMISPTIHLIETKKYTGKIGSCIKVKATDDFKVVGVDVEITNNLGAVIEKGKAAIMRTHPEFWVYLATVENLHIKGCSIKATAMDRPGNKTTRIQVI